MSDRRRNTYTSQQARFDTQSDPVEQAIEALRKEWRAGFNGTQVRVVAIPAIKSLARLASSGQAQGELASILHQLDTYFTLTIDERKTRLADLAGHLEALKPILRPAPARVPEFGKLNEAVSPGRAARNPASVPEPVSVSKTPKLRPPKLLDPTEPITALPNVADARARLLEKLGIRTIQNLLDYAPKRHIDYRKTIRIGEAINLRPGEDVTVRGQLISIDEHRGPKTSRVEARLDDGTGWIKLVWFNSYIARQLTEGEEIAVSGAIEAGFGRPSISNPEWERLNNRGLSTGRLSPVYGLTQGLTQKTMRSYTRAALDATRASIRDYLPAEIVAAENLATLVDAYEWLHYPESQIDHERSRERFAFSEMLLLQLGLTQRRRLRSSHGAYGFKVTSAELERFESQLPFRFTNAQRKVIGEITGDLQVGHPMARLLQGDVGSGKTAVAATACWLAMRNGLQSSVLAPTEILAEQHAVNFAKLFAALPESERPYVRLLTGSTRAKERREILADLVHGEINLLVGTHAVIQHDVVFRNLGLTVIDEQHRFGVRQREALPSKVHEHGSEPHVLSMTATPIPRTLNAVVHGDLEVSIIDELPPGRMPIETQMYVDGNRSPAYELIRREVASGRQVFVICPLVEESDTIDAKAAVAEAERLQVEVFPDLRVQVLHGRMAGKEKDRIMGEFRDRQADILVSTSVIEVGIDIPNATVMLIEGADRFGLAQLHQFRGRVGRGGAQSYCLLLADSPSMQGQARLKLMVETNNGFVLAEKDLEFRGPGDFLGTRQSGLPDTPWLNAAFDSQLFDRARLVSERLLATDPELSSPVMQPLRGHFDQFWENRGGFQTA